MAVPFSKAVEVTFGRPLGRRGIEVVGRHCNRGQRKANFKEKFH